MVAYFYWLALTLYTSTVSLLMFFIGISWSRLENKYSRKPWLLIIALYIFDFIIMYLAFGIPIIIQFLFMGSLVGVLYFGTQLQVIGLTGGISTGKSTVSRILAENGFDIIDADKISRDVCIRIFFVKDDLLLVVG